MNEKDIQQNNEEVEIDLQRILEAVIRKAWVVSVVSITGALLALLITIFAITPMYKSSAMFYVNNSALTVGDASLSISSGDLVTSRGLVDSYIVILKTRETLNDVIDYAGVDKSYSQVSGMISAAAVNETEIFEVVVTSADPQEAEKIANAIAYILPKRISSIIEGTSAKVVDAAVVPSKPSSPSYTKNTLLGFLLGFVLTVGIIALEEIFDISIRDEDDIAQSCNHPILASVPDMASHSKGGNYYNYGYGYGEKSDKKKSTKSKKTAIVGHGKQEAKPPVLIGSKISFAASEAYKLLRTKLQFSFADDNASHVIALSSALSGEGKSLTAVNLAYTLSQLDKKVVLIDCDMRRPTLAEKLNIRKKPGLSSFLTGQISAEALIQYCGVPGDEQAFHVIAAGECPPNPIELLSSEKMEKAIASLRKIYDYVILDLPPVGEVSDALSVAKKVDGMLLVVRQNYCNRLVLADTVRQFEFVGARVLGVVFNCTSENGGNYGKGYYKKGYYRKGYYKRYYRRYYRSYDPYAKAAESNQEGSAKR